MNISISDDVVTDMYCSCPHAADGNNCKHMAAVLFYAENDAIQNDENKSSIDSNDSCTDFSIQKLIENTGSEDIKDFLIDILKNDPMLLQQFKLKTHCKISSDDLKIYEHQIDTICKSYTDKYGYISYYETRGFYNELTGFLQNTVIKVIGNNEYAGALQLIKYLFIKLGKLSIDDSNGTLGGLAAHGITLLQSILKTCNQQVKKLLYEECKNLSMNDAVLDYLQDYITELIFSDFTEDEFLQDKLIFSENRANLFFHDKNDYSSKYSAESWVKYHIHVMKELKLTQEDIDNYCKKYLSLSGIREYYADECIQMKQYEEAVKILEDGKLADKEYPGLVHSYSEKLKEIYAKTNQRKKYIDELWHIVLEYNCGDLD
ncbi:MAG: SWIM zinc finger domain-containing protein, partial [Treponema sp.]